MIGNHVLLRRLTLESNAHEKPKRGFMHKKAMTIGLATASLLMLMIVRTLLWQRATPPLVLLSRAVARGDILSIAFSPNGELLASGMKLWDGTGEIELSRVRDHSLVALLRGHQRGVYSVAFSPNGSLLASGDGQAFSEGAGRTAINLWQVSNGTLVRTVGNHARIVWSVSFSPNGDMLASPGGGLHIDLFRVKDGSLIRTLVGHYGGIHSVAFSHDGRLLASGSEDCTVKTWSVRDGGLIRTLSGHSHWVSSVTFSMDDQFLASAGGDRTIHIWRVADGSLVRRLTGHKNEVLSISFSPDGKFLASGDRDGVVKIWGVPKWRMMGEQNMASEWRLTWRKLLFTRVPCYVPCHVRVTCLAFSSRGKLLGVSDDGGNINLFRLNVK